MATSPPETLVQMLKIHLSAWNPGRPENTEDSCLALKPCQGALPEEGPEQLFWSFPFYLQQESFFRFLQLRAPGSCSAGDTSTYGVLESSLTAEDRARVDGAALLGLLSAEQNPSGAEGSDPPSFLLFPSLSLPRSSFSSVHTLRMTN